MFLLPYTYRIDFTQHTHTHSPYLQPKVYQPNNGLEACNTLHNMQFVEQAKHRPPNTTKTKSDNLETDINCSLMAQTKPLKCVPIRNREPYALSSLLRCKRGMVSILPPAEMAIFGVNFVKREENDAKHVFDPFVSKPK